MSVWVKITVQVWSAVAVFQTPCIFHTEGTIMPLCLVEKNTLERPMGKWCQLVDTVSDEWRAFHFVLSGNINAAVFLGFKRAILKHNLIWALNHVRGDDKTRGWTGICSCFVLLSRKRYTRKNQVEPNTAASSPSRTPPLFPSAFTASHCTVWFIQQSVAGKQTDC